MKGSERESADGVVGKHQGAVFGCYHWRCDAEVDEVENQRTLAMVFEPRPT